MAKKTATKKGNKSNSNPATTHKFVPKKAFKAMKRTFGDYQKAGGVRALVVKCLPKSGATAEQVARSVSKHRKGYTPQAALNCLRWLQSQGNVSRVH